MRIICQKKNQAMKRCRILAVLHDRMANSFDASMISDRSWSVYLYHSGHILVAGRNDLIPKENQIIETQKLC
jgi:hypothetical protein